MNKSEINLTDLQQQSHKLKERIDAVLSQSESENIPEKITTIEKELKDEGNWDDYMLLGKLQKQKTGLTHKLEMIENLDKSYKDIVDFIAMALSEDDQASIPQLAKELTRVEEELSSTEIRQMFNAETDNVNAFITIKPGAGGIEAQDWAEMLFRMYSRWSEKHKFTTHVVDYSQGDEAGIKIATLHIIGEYAYGWARTEHGIHRLVRRSPFDSNHKRHTSFASVSVVPEIDDKIEISINPADLRIDVYRASGAGGQHVNRTESAVRITHLPSGIVTQCQNDRSQHKNKATAMKQLKSQLYNLEKRKKQEKNNEFIESQDDIAWGHQIRSYVLDQSRVKDNRTGVEEFNPTEILDGELDLFIIAGLRYQLTIERDEQK